MKQLSLIFLFILFYYSSQAQFFHNTIVKTNILRDVIAFNPNLAFEKPIHDKISLQLDVMYRNRVWNSSGGEGDFGKFYDGNGIKITLGSRFYFGKSKEIKSKSPFGYFVSFEVAYSYAETYNIDRTSSVSGTYLYTADSEKRWGNFNFGIGKQFYLFKTISLGIFIGPTIRTAYTEKYTYSENGSSTTEEESYKDAIMTIFGGFTIGYYIK